MDAGQNANTSTSKAGLKNFQEQVMEVTKTNVSNTKKSFVQIANENILGSIFSLLGSCCFVADAACFKIWPLKAPILLQLRYLMCFVLSLITWIVFKTFGWKIAFWPEKKAHFKHIITRSIVILALGFVYYAAIKYISIGDATAIVYSNFVITGFMGFYLLKEPFHWSYIVAVVLGISGIMFVCQPSFIFGENRMNATGAILAIISMLLLSVNLTLVRFSNYIHWTTMEFYPAVMGAFLLSPAILASEYLVGNNPFLHFELDLTALKYSLVLGSLFYFANLFFTIGGQYAYASVFSVVNVMEIPISYVAQYLIFGTNLNAFGMTGVACIIIAALILIAPQVFTATTSETDTDSAEKPLLSSKTVFDP